MSDPPRPDQRRQVYALSGNESVGGGDGTWQTDYNQARQYNLPSASTQQIPMDSDNQYGGNLGGNGYFFSSDPFAHMFDDNLVPLDSELPDSLVSLPTISVEPTNSFPTESIQNWQSHSPVHLSPIQTNVPGHSSPAFSTPSQASGSSHGFISPHPITPSSTSGNENAYVANDSGPFDSQSPATDSLRLPLDKLHLRPDQSPMSSGTSSGGSSFALPSSHNSPFLETFTYPNPSWTPVQMSPYHGMSGIANSETYSQDDSDPISASATSTMTVANSEISQARPTYSHAQQYQSWKDTPSICPIAGDVKTFVPQRMYKPHTGSDRRRYVEEVRLSLPIIFEVEGPNEWGIGLDDALKCRTKRLLDKDTLMFEGCGPSVSIRLEWPGASWSRQIPTKDFRNPPGPITKAKLAKNIAKCVQRFIKDTQDKTINDEEDTNALRFKVGPDPNDVKLEDLILVSLHHVSQGSWQPQLRLKRHF